MKMKSAAKRLLNQLFGSRLDPVRKARSMARHRRGIASFGQEGEDRVIASLLFKLHGGSLPTTGFYIDIGAHHPFLYSNTYAFYELGWSGLNIDAAPGSMDSFKLHRPRDTNIEIGIGQTRLTASFHIFNEPALSTFSDRLARERAVAPHKVIAVVPVEIAPTREIFERYIQPQQKIDFLTVDVEGLDMEVLKSNDWQVFRPMIVAVEIYGQTIAEALQDEAAIFLAGQRYIFYAKTVNTALFVDAELFHKLARPHGAEAS